MAQLEAFELPGFELWFNSNDHLPPHFHVEKSGTWEVRVLFLRRGNEMFERVWGRNSPSGKVKQQIAGLVDAHREALLVEWEAKVEVKAPGPGR